MMANTKVVEYLVPLMSKELLYKFPDNSAFDFDYSQSSIWSPLVTRAYCPIDLDLDLITPRKLTYEMGLELNGENSLKKVGSKIKKKFTNNGFHLLRKQQQQKKKKMSSDLSPTPTRIKGTCNPIFVKGWNKVLKAASIQFKKRKMKKDPMVHVKLSKSKYPTI
ncbi:hypothetical protein O6P43_014408 [Quillaja saponaria]|uniref:Uncharacterized protein n=1 Tax=Quillaja saponaria TaxID=32244 RepID=A0AAD7LV72_QUISA|nr:hypothetical protein O6P43_014408 [Quillaja saponaria]